MPKVDVDNIQWRALTPLECERLQTVPDGCTRYGNFDDGKRENVFSFQTAEDIKPISNSQRYKMLGNGFCVSTIANILKGVDYDEGS